jgi:hypothetical protein
MVAKRNNGFYVTMAKNEGVQGRSNPPLWDTEYLNFQNEKKNVLLWKMSSRGSKLHYTSIRFLYLN